MPNDTFTWRHQYDSVRDKLEGDLAAIANDEPSMTKQSFTEDTDINVMMRRMGVTDGAIPPAQLMTIANLDPSYYGDFTDQTDFKTALDRIRTAYDRFDALPAELRARFDNEPMELYKWVNDPTNKDEAIALKILRNDPTRAPVPQTQEERNNARLAAVQKEFADYKAAQLPIPATTPSAAAATPQPTKTP